MSKTAPTVFVDIYWIRVTYTLRAERTRDRWQFAAGLAAAVLLWMNLSMSASQATDFGLHPSALDDVIEAGKSGQQEPSLRIDSTLSCLPDLSGHADALDNTNSRLIFRPGPNSQKERQ